MPLRLVLATADLLLAAAANKNMNVKVFSTPVCPYCHTLKEFLKANGIAFEDIDVSSNEAMRDDMIKKSGQMGVPVVYVDDEVIVGFDREKIVKLLNIKE